jgi:hypothetical protein
MTLECKSLALSLVGLALGWTDKDQFKGIGSGKSEQLAGSGGNFPQKSASSQFLAWC